MRLIRFKEGALNEYDAKEREYSLEEEFLEGTTVHLRRRLDAGDVQERRRQIDVQNYVVYSATWMQRYADIPVRELPDVVGTLARAFRAFICLGQSFTDNSVYNDSASRTACVLGIL